MKKKEVQQPLQNEKTSVPGQQVGLYCEADARDVKQMVSLLNNPGDENQESRG